MVVLGNPPYANFGRMNRGGWILGLLKDYKEGLHEKKLNLDDDFIKFIRFAQWRIDKTGYGILGFITNNTYLDGITHRRMRESLMQSFSNIYVLDLHGSVKKKDKAPDGSEDKNVFDIQLGVGVSLLVKRSGSAAAERVNHSQLWGNRSKKYETLSATDVSSTNWSSLTPTPKYFFFAPKEFAMRQEYETFPSIAGDLFLNYNAGIQTKRDNLVYHFTRNEIEDVVHQIQSLDPNEIAQRFQLPPDGRDWRVAWAKSDANRGGTFTRVLYHPFDFRWTYYTGRTKGFMAYPRYPLMASALQPNLLLLCVRNARRGNVDSFFVANTIVDKDAVSPFDNVTFFPLYARLPENPGGKQGQLSLHGQRDGTAPTKAQLNLKRDVIEAWGKRMGLRFGEKHTDIHEGVFDAESLTSYVYAILWSTSYRVRYTELLRIEFPRVPLTADKKLFAFLVEKGEELISLHLMESPKLANFITRYEQPGDHTVEKVRYIEPNPKAGIKTGRVYINGAQYFDGVPKEVWEFQIGGYQVCEKWLKDRKGRRLSSDDIDHYQKIAVALAETIRLMREIDEIIPAWPLP